MNHLRWNERDRDTAENIICGIANDGMWFWELKEMNRDTTGIPIDDIRNLDGRGNSNDPYVQLVRECQTTCILEMRKAGLEIRVIAEAMYVEQSTVRKRIKHHMKVKR